MSHIAVVQWLRTRILLWKIVTLWGVLTLSCMVTDHAAVGHPTAILRLSLLTLLLIVFFRLWDDLTDRAFDRQYATNHQRILVQATDSVIPVFYGFGIALLLWIILLLYLFHGVLIVATFFVLIGFMAVVYYCLPALTPRRTLRTILVLLKYPAMLMVLTGGQLNLKTSLMALLVYGLLLIYECYDSRITNT